MVHGRWCPKWVRGTGQAGQTSPAGWTNIVGLFGLQLEISPASRPRALLTACCSLFCLCIRPFTCGVPCPPFTCGVPCPCSRAARRAAFLFFMLLTCGRPTLRPASSAESIPQVYLPWGKVDQCKFSDSQRSPHAALCPLCTPLQRTQRTHIHEEVKTGPRRASLVLSRIP